MPIRTVLRNQVLTLAPPRAPRGGGTKCWIVRDHPDRSRLIARRTGCRILRGLGLRYDELPRPSDLETKVEPGMCICVQLHVRLPGIIVGQGDSVLVTDGAPEILSDAH